MNALVRILAILGLLLHCAGCTQKQEDESKEPIEVKKAERADSTRLDPSSADSLSGGEDGAR